MTDPAAATPARADGAPVVQVRGLTVERGGSDVVVDVSFDLLPGRVTGLLGPSGCGKTTLMRCVVGVQVVKAGEVTVLGLPAGDAPLRDRIGYVTQAPSVYADLTVAENLHFFARVLGVGAEEVDRVARLVDLQDRLGQVVARMSGGQQSRVSLAVALLGAPAVLVLDEPTVGLDPVLRRELWTVFHDLADSGVGVLVSSHVMDEAERCDSLLLMRAGRLIADDSPAALLEATGEPTVEHAFLALVEGSGRP
jgi:ABC-2 type transport system ATP-binding protein